MQCRVRTPQADGCSGLHRGDVAHQRGERPQLCFNCVCSWGPHGETSVRNISSQTVEFHCTHARTCILIILTCYFYLNCIQYFIWILFLCKYKGKIFCLLRLFDLLIFIHSRLKHIKKLFLYVSMPSRNIEWCANTEEIKWRGVSNFILSYWFWNQNSE